MSFLPRRVGSLINAERLGIAGIAGVGLWLFCLSFYAGTVRSTEQGARTLREEEAKLVATLASFKRNSVPRAVAQTQHALPALITAPELVEKLGTVAEKNGLTIEHTSYHLDENEHQRRIEVSLPLKGSYPTLRVYLREALALGDGATLDELSLQRVQSSDPMVDANSRLSYYFSAPFTPSPSKSSPVVVVENGGDPIYFPVKQDATKTPDSIQVAIEPKIVDIFGVRTWEPPKPVVVVNPGPPPPPPPPQAPPLPFRLLGKINDPQRGMTFMLLRGEEILSVVVGDTIGNTYRVDKFNHGQLEFIYQPLSIRQSLPVGSDL